MLRQRAAAAKGRRSESTRREPRESKALPVTDANAKSQASLQVFHFSCSSNWVYGVHILFSVTRTCDAEKVSL